MVDHSRLNDIFFKGDDQVGVLAVAVLTILDDLVAVLDEIIFFVHTAHMLPNDGFAVGFEDSEVWVFGAEVVGKP